MNKLKKIIVPIDDSASSKRALDNAIFLASISDAVITGIYIIHSKSDNGSFLNMMKPLSTLDEKGFVG